MKAGLKILEISLYRVVWNAFRYLEPFRRGSRLWQMDRRTGRRPAVRNGAVLWVINSDPLKRQPMIITLVGEWNAGWGWKFAIFYQYLILFGEFRKRHAHVVILWNSSSMSTMCMVSRAVPYSRQPSSLTVKYEQRDPLSHSRHNAGDKWRKWEHESGSWNSMPWSSNRKVGYIRWWSFELS